MSLRMSIVLLCVIVWASPSHSISPTSYLTSSDKVRLTSLFSSSLTEDSASIHYSVLGLRDLKETVPDTKDLCGLVAKSANDGNVETLYHAAETGAALGCPLVLGKEAAAAVKAGFADGATTASIFYSAKTLAATGAKISSEAVKKSLAAALKKDDALLSLGLAFHTASMLEGDLAPFFERIEDAVVQADEVNGEMLQFEGGLSVTSLLITGAAKLAVKSKKPLPLTGEQTIKFANYLMSRKSVQQVKGAHHLVEAVQTLASNPQFVPVVVALASSVSVSADNPSLVLSLTDLAGDSPGDFSLVLETATRLEDGAVVAAKQPLTHMKTTTKYTTDLMESNSPAGFYEIVLSATPAKPDKKFVGMTDVTVGVKVLTSVTVEAAEIKISDTDSSSAKTTKLQFPGKASQKLNLDYKEKLSVSFTVTDSGTDKPRLVHQAFVKLSHAASNAEIVYVAESNSKKQYTFELDMNTAVQDFNSKSGKYSLTVIIGDAVISNPTAWLAAELDIKLPEEEKTKEAGMFEVKPEIIHKFREPEARPATVVSNTFALLCLVPVLLMLGLWLKIGINCSNFSFSPAAVGFHIGLASIFVLYFYFWLELDMFATVKYLSCIGLVTFLCGNSLLASIARSKKTA